MLPKKNRISRSLFTSLLHTKEKYSSKYMFLRVAQPLAGDTKTPHIKVSFVVSKKYCKTAVGRHMFRRLGYTVVQNELKNMQEGLLLGFFVTQNIQNVPKGELQQDIKNLLSKSGVYKK